MKSPSPWPPGISVPTSTSLETAWHKTSLTNQQTDPVSAMPLMLAVSWTLFEAGLQNHVWDLPRSVKSCKLTQLWWLWPIFKVAYSLNKKKIVVLLIFSVDWLSIWFTCWLWVLMTSAVTECFWLVGLHCAQQGAEAAREGEADDGREERAETAGEGRAAHWRNWAGDPASESGRSKVSLTCASRGCNNNNNDDYYKMIIIIKCNDSEDVVNSPNLQ